MVSQPGAVRALAGMGKLVELRQRLLFVLGALIVYRLGTFIPVPGVDPEAMTRFMNQQGGIIDLFNMFSGGALERFSIFALNVIPYISASIIVQLLSAVLPSLQALKKEGEAGRRKLTEYTRYGTVLLAAFQAAGVAVALQAQGGIVYITGPAFVFSAVVGLTAGTLFLMWLGEQITERGVGNGISLIIFAGIVSGLPGAVGAVIELARTGQLGPLRVLFIFVVVALITAFVVFIERAQRRIPVNYARRQLGRGQYAQHSAHLPLKLNMSGVIPAIFASSIIMFPATAAGWFGTAGEGSRWLQRIAAMLTPGEPLYIVLFGGLIILFAFFYTALIFNAQETADNLKRSGALIPGIRPGKATGEYIDGVLTRLTFWGSIYLAAVCLVPDFLRIAWKVPFYFGGTSLLIVVVVVMDFTAQIQAHLMSHQYESLLKKANLKSYGRSGVVRS